MSELSVAAAELRKISRAFAGLSALESCVDAALRAESAVASAKGELTALNAAIVEKREKSDDEEKAVAKHYAQLLENVAKAEDAAAAEAKFKLAETNAQYAKLIALAEGQLTDLATCTNDAMVELADSHEALAHIDAELDIAEKKLSDINAAIAAIANR